MHWLRSLIHNALGSLFHALGRLLQRTKKWDRTP